MRAPRRSTLTLLCALVPAGCSDHRYGFFPVTEGDGSTSFTTTDTTTTLSPTTVSPTTVTPTTVPPTTLPPTTIEPTTTIVTETTITTTTGGVECGQIVLAPDVPQTQFFSLFGQPDQFGLVCGGTGGVDIAALWTAPFDGRFQFDTIGSSFDSLIGVLNGFCGGPELGCDDDGAGNLQSKLELDMFAGQEVTIVVDSFTHDGGDVVLNVSQVVQPGECPDTQFEPIVPLEIPGQTAGASNLRAGLCGGSDSPEIEAQWFAPFDALFRFRIIESDFDPVMYLLQDSCDGPELICSDDFNGLNPSFDVPLSAGQPVVIVVDGLGSSGKFTLRIESL